MTLNAHMSVVCLCCSNVIHISFKQITVRREPKREQPIYCTMPVAQPPHKITSTRDKTPHQTLALKLMVSPNTLSFTYPGFLQNSLIFLEVKSVWKLTFNLHNLFTLMNKRDSSRMFLHCLHNVMFVQIRLVFRPLGKICNASKQQD